MKKATKRAALEVGAGVAAAGALAAAAAYLLSDKKRRASAEAWAKKARTEVAKRVRNARTMGKAEYGRLVGEATKRYGALQNIDRTELERVARELRADWDKWQKNAKSIARMVRKRRKRSARAARSSSRSIKKSRGGGRRSR